MWLRVGDRIGPNTSSNKTFLTERLLGSAAGSAAKRGKQCVSETSLLRVRVSEVPIWFRAPWSGSSMTTLQINLPLWYREPSVSFSPSSGPITHDLHRVPLASTTSTNNLNQRPPSQRLLLAHVPVPQPQNCCLYIMDPSIDRTRRTQDGPCSCTQPPLRR